VTADIRERTVICCGAVPQQFVDVQPVGKRQVERSGHRQLPSCLAPFARASSASAHASALITSACARDRKISCSPECEDIRNYMRDWRRRYSSTLVHIAIAPCPSAVTFGRSFAPTNAGARHIGKWCPGRRRRRERTKRADTAEQSSTPRTPAARFSAAATARYRRDNDIRTAARRAGRTCLACENRFYAARLDQLKCRSCRNRWS
jgi:hypothetical protein